MYECTYQMTLKIVAACIQLCEVQLASWIVCTSDLQLKSWNKTMTWQPSSFAWKNALYLMFAVRNGHLLPKNDLGRLWHPEPQLINLNAFQNCIKPNKNKTYIWSFWTEWCQRFKEHKKQNPTDGFTHKRPCVKGQSRCRLQVQVIRQNLHLLPMLQAIDFQCQSLYKVPHQHYINFTWLWIWHPDSWKFKNAYLLTLENWTWRIQFTVTSTLWREKTWPFTFSDKELFMILDVWCTMSALYWRKCIC